MGIAWQSVAEVSPFKIEMKIGNGEVNKSSPFLTEELEGILKAFKIPLCPPLKKREARDRVTTSRISLSSIRAAGRGRSCPLSPSP
jgi:hypothetical protein